MKLVLATPLYPPEPGGPATYAKLLEEGLLSQGVSVEVVKFSSVRHLPKLIRHIAYFFAVLRAAGRGDTVLALDPVSVGLPALLAAALARKPFFVKVVGDYAWEQGTQRFGVTLSLDAFVNTKQVPLQVYILRNIQTFVARHARAVIVPSNYLKGILMKWGIKEEQITVIYNAVSIDCIGTVPDVIKNLPSPLVVSVGRLVPWKGMEGVIDAVALVRERGTPLSLAIVGDGPLETQLSSKANEALQENYVLSGRLSHEDTLAVIQHADVFVLNSSYEGLSHLLIEALLLNTPIVATDAGGNSEVVTGSLVPVGDTGALAATLMSTLHQSKPVYSGKEYFSLPTMFTKTAALLKQHS